MHVQWLPVLSCFTGIHFSRFGIHDRHSVVMPFSKSKLIFTKSPWNEERLFEKLQERVLPQIERLAKRTNQPLFLSMDDTICQKTKPSSRATHVIQGCDCHDSHKDHQMVWGAFARLADGAHLHASVSVRVPLV